MTSLEPYPVASCLVCEKCFARAGVEVDADPGDETPVPIPPDCNPSDFHSALYFTELANEGCTRHLGYIYPDQLPAIPVNKRVKIAVEYEVEGVDYHNAKQE